MFLRKIHKYHHYHFRQNFCQLAFHISTSSSALKKPVRKEITSRGDSQILHKIVSDTTQISLCFSDFRVFSRIISCSISESLLHLIFFLAVQSLRKIVFIIVSYVGSRTVTLQKNNNEINRQKLLINQFSLILMS